MPIYSTHHFVRQLIKGVYENLEEYENAKRLTVDISKRRPSNTDVAINWARDDGSQTVVPGREVHNILMRLKDEV